MTARVVVTGAGGFVGHHLCRRLVESGYCVKTISRVPSPLLTALVGNAVVVGDMNLVSDWRSLIDDSDCVIHLAGRPGGQPGNESKLSDQYIRDNLEITKSLVNDAKEIGVQQLIFMSTIKVFGDGPFAFPLKITDVPDPSDAYGQSKFQAEKWILGACGLGTLEPVIVRSPLVYGPMVRGNFLRLMRLVRSGRPLPLASAGNLRSFVNIWNLTDVVVRLIESRGHVRGVWHVSDDEDCSTKRLVEEIARNLDVKLRLFGLPPILVKVCLQLLGRRGGYQRLFGSMQLDVTTTKASLGWQPPVTLDEGLARTASWFRNEANLAQR